MTDRDPAIVCVDKPADMAAILSRDYADAPLSFAPSPLIAVYAKQWRRRDDVYFTRIDVDGRYGGFVFGHALGAQPWRRLLAAPFWTAPAMAAIYARMKLGAPSVAPPVAQSAAQSGTGAGAEAGAHENQDPVAPIWSEEAIPAERLATPFAMLEFFYAAPEFRGCGVGGRLIAAFEAAAAANGRDRLRAHISPWNIASVRAFLRAGWAVHRAAPQSLLATKLL